MYRETETDLSREVGLEVGRDAVPHEVEGVVLRPRPALSQSE